MDNSTEDALIYKDKEPDVLALRQAYEQTTNELESFFDSCRESYDDRRNYWPGKSRDLRKHGADAFPWDGASDMEAHVIDERINAMVAICCAGLPRANAPAHPVAICDPAPSRGSPAALNCIALPYIPVLPK